MFSAFAMNVFIGVNAKWNKTTIVNDYSYFFNNSKLHIKPQPCGCKFQFGLNAPAGGLTRLHPLS